MEYLLNTQRPNDGYYGDVFMLGSFVVGLVNNN